MRHSRGDNLFTRKLKSNSGASLILALLFFVMCAVVGSVVLAAASAATGRIRNLQKNSQEEYTLSSCAKLLCEKLSGKEIVIKNFLDETPLPTGTSATFEDSVTALIESVYISQWNEIKVNRIENNPGTDRFSLLEQNTGITRDQTSAKKGEFSVAVAGESQLEPVKASVYVYPDYVIEIDLTMEGASEDAVSQRLTVWMENPGADCVVSNYTDPSSEKTGTYVQTRITLGEPVIYLNDKKEVIL